MLPLELNKARALVPIGLLSSCKVYGFVERCVSLFHFVSYPKEPAEFFDVETYPTMDFRSTGIRLEDGDFLVDGDLTIRGITKPATFSLDFGGFGTDPWGNYKAGATAKTVVNREDFGLTWNAALETGGVLVGKDVTIELDLQLALQA